MHAASGQPLRTLRDSPSTVAPRCFKCSVYQRELTSHLHYLLQIGPAVALDLAQGLLHARPAL